MGRAKVQGPCVACGQSLGQHTQRAARRHREAWDEAIATAALVTMIGGVGRVLFEMFHGPLDKELPSFAGELETAVIEAAGREVSRERA